MNKEQKIKKQRTQTPLPPMNLRGFFRWSWHQLTSMNTALLLLLLVALAAIPGSILPQKTASLLRVRRWKENNPDLAKIFEQLGLFDVYGSFWFSAIYILLMISLIGCVIPRLKVYWQNLNEIPPQTPESIIRFSGYQKINLKNNSYKSIQKVLKKQKWRLNISGNSLTAEKGYMREAGNLVFHASLILITIAVAFGALFNYRGTIIVKEGNGFANNLTQYDDFHAGKFFKEKSMPNFYFYLKNFEVDFERGLNQRGAPRGFVASISLENAGQVEDVDVLVNKPIEIDGTKIYLTGHGYAPRIEVKDKNNEIVFSDSVTFLPQDANFSSIGVIKIPDESPQIGINARFLPTAEIDPLNGPVSTFPGLDDPELFMSFWQGDLGVNEGTPQSIYRLETSNMVETGLEELKPGQTWKLDNGYSVTFQNVERFASFQISYDPAKGFALAGAIFAMLGMFFGLGIQRRRIFLKISTKSDKSVMELSGLSKSATHDVGLDINRLLVELKLAKPFKKDRNL